MKDPRSPLVTKPHNWGIDFLRIVAAFYVVILHTIKNGGILNAVTPHSYQFLVGQILNTWTYCAVNIFGIISGYVGYTKTAKLFKPENYLTLWLEVVFYGVTVTLGCYLLIPSSRTEFSLLPMFFPLSNNLYWYFTAFTLLFCFTPLINSAVRNCSQNYLIFLFLLILLVFSPWETQKDYFFANRGYSFLWLLILYLIGAILKKMGWADKVSPIVAFLCLIAVNLLSVLLCCRYSRLCFLSDYIDPSLYKKYTYPGYLLSAILHLLLFANLKPGRLLQKLIRFCAPAAFAVYIVNVNPCIWDYSNNAFHTWAGSSPLGMLARILIFAFVFIAITTFLDALRRKLFFLLRIQSLLQGLCSFIQKNGTPFPNTPSNQQNTNNRV